MLTKLCTFLLLSLLLLCLSIQQASCSSLVVEAEQHTNNEFIVPFPSSNLNPSYLSIYNPLTSSAVQEAPLPFFTQAPQQCSCPACGCNAQQTCPKTITANSYTVLSSMEDCGSQVPGIGLVNIQSTNSDGFKYYLVDEANKNKAMNNEQFSYSTYKSGNEGYTCVSDSLASFRFPTVSPGKAFLIARNTNALLSSSVRFNIQMSCVVPPFNSVGISVGSGDYTKLYVGQQMSWTFTFKNQYSNTDTWQKGSLSASIGNGVVSNGVGSISYTPSSTGFISGLIVRYTPDGSVYGNAIDIQSQSFQVVRMGDSGKFEISQTNFKVNSAFEVKYTIYDSDGGITPKVDLSKLSITCDEVKLNCNTPSSTSGSSSATCIAPTSNIGVIVLKFDGRNLATSRSVVFSDASIIKMQYLQLLLCFIVAVLLVA